MIDRESQYEIDALSKLLQTEFGSNTLWMILHLCGIYCTTYSSDPLHTAYLEGRRSIGLHLIDLIQQTDPKAYAQLLMDKQAEEARQRHIEENQNGKREI